MSNIIYRPVNWLNGMNINQSHFVKEQMSNLSMQMSVTETFLSPYNYGIVTVGDNNDERIWIDINDNLGINVELINIRVLFPNGYLLQIEGRDEDFGVFYAKLPELQAGDDCAIVLSVHPEDRTSYGNPDPDEIPIRKPFVVPGVNVSVVNINEVNATLYGQKYVIIGKLYNEDGSWRLDSDYIPAVHRVVDSPNLVRVHHNFENYLSSIERSTIEIIQKVRQKKQNNELASILLDLSLKLNVILVEEITGYKAEGIYRTPIQMLSTFLRIARLLNNVLETWQSCGKDEMMTYLSDWCDISEGEFEKLIHGLIHLKYNHNDINKSIQKATHFADVISAMFTVLASLDYIGKKIETNLFVAEEKDEEKVDTGTTKKKRKFSLLGN